MKQYTDRPWDEYPIGTIAHSEQIGDCIMIEEGWEWPSGNIFPAPCCDALFVTLPGNNKPDWGTK